MNWLAILAAILPQILPIIEAILKVIGAFNQTTAASPALAGAPPEMTPELHAALLDLNKAVNR